MPLLPLLNDRYVSRYSRGSSYVQVCFSYKLTLIFPIALDFADLVARFLCIQFLYHFINIVIIFILLVNPNEQRYTMFCLSQSELVWFLPAPSHTRQDTELSCSTGKCFWTSDFTGKLKKRRCSQTGKSLTWKNRHSPCTQSFPALPEERIFLSGKVQSLLSAAFTLFIYHFWCPSLLCFHPSKLVID